MSTVDAIIAHVLPLEISLYHACARLEARTDPEALHDLRIAVRRLRSLLKPLRGKDGVVDLERAAAAVGQLTTPMRDLEVLIDELHNRGLGEAANAREATLAAGYAEVVQSPVLQQLFTSLDAARIRSIPGERAETLPSACERGLIRAHWEPDRGSCAAWPPTDRA